jgi:hypothetical protein
MLHGHLRASFETRVQEAVKTLMAPAVTSASSNCRNGAMTGLMSGRSDGTARVPPIRFTR